MTGSTLIRDATPADGRAIARVHHSSWQTTYRGLFPDELLDDADMDVWAANRERMIRELPPDRFYLVAESDGEIVGFCTGGPARDAAEDAEVYAIYLLKEHQGRGIGRELMRESARRFAGRGMRDLLVWVLRENAGARAFYESLGGRADREKQDTVGAPGRARHEITEVAYVWDDLSGLAV